MTNTAERPPAPQTAPRTAKRARTPRTAKQAQTAPHAADHDDAVAELVTRLFGDDAALSRRELARRLRMSAEVIKLAIENGHLSEVRISERKLVITPSQVTRYLRSLQNGSERVHGAADGPT